MAQPISDKHYVSAGGFIPIASKQNDFIIVTSYEHRIRSGKSPLGIGVTVNFAKFSIIDKKDFGITPRLYFHLLEKNKADFYIGTGLGYAKQVQIDNNVTQKSGVTFKYFLGIRYNIKRHVFGSFEVSNYRYSMGVYPTLNIGVNI